MSKVCKEVIALVINNDKCREVLYINLADSLHAELWEVYNLNALDRVLCKDSCWATDRAEVEATVSLTSVSNSL